MYPLNYPVVIQAGDPHCYLKKQWRSRLIFKETYCKFVCIQWQL